MIDSIKNAIKRKSKFIPINKINLTVNMYRTNIKPLGYVVAGLGFVCLGVGVIPNGLGFVAYPLGFALLGAVGIRFSARDVYRKFEFTRRFL